MTKPDIQSIRSRLEKATPGPWLSMREGNQFLGAVTVGASRVVGICRPWNPHFLVPASQLEEVARFTDGDADFIAACKQDIPALLSYVAELESRAEKIAKAIEAAREWRSPLKVKHMDAVMTGAILSQMRAHFDAILTAYSAEPNPPITENTQS